jgi:hypothetical protein
MTKKAAATTHSCAGGGILPLLSLFLCSNIVAVYRLILFRQICFGNNMQLSHILKKREDVMSTVVETSRLL